MEKQATNTRRLILGVALVVTVFAVIWLDENDADIEETIQPILPASPASRSASVSGKKSDIGPLQVDQLGQRKFNAEADDIFASASWEPKQPRADLSQSPFGGSGGAGGSNQVAKSAPVRVPPPTAPPLQFKYIGKIMEGKMTRVFLSMGDNYYVAKVGGRIEKNYRVDRINDDVIEFTYIPLGIKQKLLINNNPGKF